MMASPSSAGGLNTCPRSVLHTVCDAPTARVAVKLSETPGEIATRPPTLGEHTDQVLAGIGYDADAIAELRKNQIV